MIDWNRVIELRNEVGPDEFGPVLELFMDEVEEIVMRLDASDPARLARDMHFLKGSAWNLGFAEFGALCQQGETLAMRGRTEDVKPEDFVACYSTSKQIFMRDLACAVGPDQEETGVA
ncbi:MAG: Hpt domain-containing protein [Paracoccus sp. (in: a-proteobacteria)]|uniref:Hpt domain-containing protein n=1 Tax=Paracoccus sp. TaxID=267 RepID=UPI0026E10FCB|nr:Hpt domain-containing protein [Paracoccus sp. (in: a-proteobacteria)]MDO5632765.1 Hpt domain-containing protein [Paracoccus sp. (in: a-proteobacteria)]